MRIFYVSDTTPNASLKSNLWRSNLYLPLIGLCHDVVEFRYDFGKTFQNLNSAYPEQERFIKENRPKLTLELLNQVKKAHAERPIDLFFSYFYDACVLPEAIDEIRGMGIKAVNWYCNGSYQLHLVREISPHYDWCLVPEKFRINDYIAMGANPIYCQEAANPDVYKPFNLPLEFDVTFVGQAYGERPAYIGHLLDKGIDVRVWGYGWHNHAASGMRGYMQRAGHFARRLTTRDGWRSAGRRAGKLIRGDGDADGVAQVAPRRLMPASVLGGILSDVEMIKMFSRSKINLGFSSCGETHLGGERILQVRLRDFEVPMSGGFYMVEYMEELEEFFDIGREIVCYENREDLADKIKYYLAHDGEREEIRLAGYRRCLGDHTWHKRFAAAFKEMGLAG